MVCRFTGHGWREIILPVCLFDCLYVCLNSAWLFVGLSVGLNGGVHITVSGRSHDYLSAEQRRYFTTDIFSELKPMLSVVPTNQTQIASDPIDGCTPSSYSNTKPAFLLSFLLSSSHARRKESSSGKREEEKEEEGWKKGRQENAKKREEGLNERTNDQEKENKESF